MINRPLRHKPQQWGWSKGLITPDLARLLDQAVLFFPFWEGSGSDAQDLITRTHHSITGTLEWEETKIGTAFHFNGGEEIVVDPIPDNAHPYTVIIMIMGDADPPTSIEQPVNWEQGSGANSRCLFSWGHSNAAFRQAWATNDGSWDALKYTTTLVKDTLYVLGCRHDGVTMEIFLDGIKDTPSSTRVSSASNNAYNIGSAGGASYFNGHIFYHLHFSGIALSDGDMLRIADRMHELAALEWPKPILADQGAGATEVTVTGNKPASTGALSKIKYLIGMAGTKPASTGTVSAQQTLLRSLAGAKPASTGTLTALQTLLRSLAGNKPASTGALSLIEYQIALAGNKPASTGTISAQSIVAVDVAGNKPASTGAISQVQYQIALAGNKPASTGTLSAQQTLLVSLAGAKPASTGAVAALQTLNRSLAGNKPVSTGSLSLLWIVAALAGAKPASTGTISGVPVVVAAFVGIRTIESLGDQRSLDSLGDQRSLGRG